MTRRFSGQRFASLGYAQYTVTNSSAVKPYTTSPGSGENFPTGDVLEMHMRSNGDFRYRSDGTSPTTALGMTIFQNEWFVFDGDVSNFEFISKTGTITIDLEYHG